MDAKKTEDVFKKVYIDTCKERDKYKAERDTLIDDLSWYKAKVSRLERENEQKTKVIQMLEKESAWNKNGKIEWWGKYATNRNLLSEISQHIGRKPSSSTYKYFRAKLDNLNITEDK